MSLFHSPQIITNGLIFYFDAKNIKSYSRSGTTCIDLLGSSTTGETVNSPTFNTNGYFSFVTDDYIRFTNSTVLDVQNFTIEVWVKTNSTNQNGFWFEKGTVNTQYSLFQEGNSIICRVHTGVNYINAISIATASYMNTSSWYQVVFTFTSGSQVCYVNSAQAGTGTTSGTLATNSGGMSIGAYGGYTGGSGYYYNGDLAIAKVYNRVLSQVEVQQNFNATRSRFGV
jgi:hypothetical protein